MKKIMAIASHGGHWLQLNRLKPFYDKHEVVFVTTEPTVRTLRPDVKIVRDANRNEKLSILICFVQLLVLLIKERPDLIISTGALPGVLALFIGRFLGRKTVWIDSIANAEELSMSGKLAGKFAHKWLTQWPELAHEGGPEFQGRVL